MFIPKVSVLMANYNGERFWHRRLYQFLNKVIKILSSSLLTMVQRILALRFFVLLCCKIVSKFFIVLVIEVLLVL